MDNICPVCKSDKSVAIDIRGSAEYLSLVYIGHGGARLHACLDCGVVYIDNFDRDSMLSRLIQKPRRRNSNEK